MNKSVERAIQVLNYFALHHQRGVGISQIAREFKMPKSSASDIIYSLLDLGCLEYDNEELKTFRLGLGAVKIGMSALDKMDLLKCAKEEMKRLHDKTGFSVLLGVMTGDTMTYVDKIEGGNAIRLANGVGTSLPLHLTAVGKVILSDRSDDDILNLIGDTCFEAHTKNSITTSKRLLSEMAKIRKNGYAVEDFEENDYVYSIAAPIRDASGKVVAGVCVSMFLTDVSTENVKNIMTQVCEAGTVISNHLGYRKDKE